MAKCVLSSTLQPALAAPAAQGHTTSARSLFRSQRKFRDNACRQAIDLSKLLGIRSYDTGPMTIDEHALWDRLYNSARTTEAVQSRDRDTASSSEHKHPCRAARHVLRD